MEVMQDEVQAAPAAEAGATAAGEEEEEEVENSSESDSDEHPWSKNASNLAILKSKKRP